MADWESGLCASLPAAAALPLFLVMHLLAWQFVATRWKSVAGLVLTATVAFGLTLAAAAFVGRVTQETLWVSLPLYAALVTLYMHLYFGMDRSLSVRMLGELSKQPDGFLTLDELELVYSCRDMVERRVQVLSDKDLAVESQRQYTCTGRARFMVTLAILGKRLYGLRCTG